MVRYYKVLRKEFDKFLRDVTSTQKANNWFVNVAVVKEQGDLITVRVG